jgi:hypothetical protein
MKVKIENTEYPVIDSLGELPLGRFVDVMKLKRKYESPENDLTEIDFIIKLIELVTEIPGEEIYKIDFISYEKLYQFILEMIKEKLPEAYEDSLDIELDGKKFRFDTRVENMPMAMMWDLEDLLKKNLYEDNTAVLIATTLIRPVDDKNELVKYSYLIADKNIELMNEKLLMKDFNPVSVFFLIFGSELLNAQSSETYG